MMHKMKTTRLVSISVAFICLFCVSANGLAQDAILRIHGAVKTPLDLTVKEIEAMEKFHVNAVYLMKEKQRRSDADEFIGTADFEGVLLRDLLEKAGMKYVRKYEPGVFIRVKGADNRESVFSFGEIFYSSIGRSTLLACAKNGAPIDPAHGRLELVVANDIRNSRQVSAVSDIMVERVDIEMKVYEERKQHIDQPPTSHFTLTDRKSGTSKEIGMAELEALPQISIRDKVQAGDCEGFHGVYSYEGVTLRSLLEQQKVVDFPYPYNRFVAVSSKNGFCATYSIGEIFNSRLGNNIIIAVKKDGKPLGEDEAFAMMVAEEDNTGGRSVKRIDAMIFY